MSTLTDSNANIESQDESVIYFGSPHLMVNHQDYLAGFLAGLLVFTLPIVFLYISFVVIRSQNEKIKITNQRISITTGLINKNTSELELYRIKDMEIQTPWYYRLFGTGNLYLITSDETDPNLIIKALPNINQIKEKLRIAIEKTKQDKGLLDIESV